MTNLGGSIGASLAGEEVELLPQGAIYWPSEKIMFLADLHLGKANHFRKAGIAVPLNIQERNLKRLTEVLEVREASDVFFLGDLFHSEWNQSWQAFTEVLNAFPETEFHLVMGNHDILSSTQYDQTSLNLHQEGLEVGPFQLDHHPNRPGEGYRLCGHLHPAVRLRGRGKQGMKLPCFWQSSHQMVLPAFGGFTGMATIRPKKGDCVYLILKDRVEKITSDS